MAGAKYLTLSWPTYHNLALKLARSILSQKTKPQQIVAISRGGLTLGHILSDFLRIPVSTITIQSYLDIKTQGKLELTEKLKTPIKGKKILLVDDVADSGKTITRAISYLKKLQPSDITTATLLYKSHSKIRPDIYTAKTNKWIIFPYESTEMQLLISRKMQLEGKSKAEIQRLLTKLRFSPAQIQFTVKYHSSPSFSDK